MTGYFITPKAEEDLVEGARWIRSDNPGAARKFLDGVFHAFDQLVRFPKSGPVARLKHKRLSDVRFWVLSPPFNRWLVFYRLTRDEVVIIRVIYGTQNWRAKPTSFFT